MGLGARGEGTINEPFAKIHVSRRENEDMVANDENDASLIISAKFFLILRIHGPYEAADRFLEERVNVKIRPVGEPAVEAATYFLRHRYFR
jgi:hypothetical protein